MAVKLKKGIKLSDLPGTKGRLPNLAKFWCFGLTIQASVPRPWKTVAERLAAVIENDFEGSGEPVLHFEYKSRDGAEHSVRIELASSAGRRCTNLSVQVANDRLTDEVFGWEGAGIAYFIHDYVRLAEHSYPWGGPGAPERRDARDLRALLAALGMLGERPLRIRTDAGFYFQLPREALQPWVQRWPGLGPVEVNGIMFTAKRGGLSVMMRLTEFVEHVAARHLFASLKGIRMRSSLDAGILDRASNAAFRAVLPFVQVTRGNEDK